MINISKEYLYEEYEIKQRKIKDIAANMRCSSHTISYYLKKYNLKISNETKYIGKKYGKLTINKLVGKTKNGKLICECSCDCGTIKETIVSDLTSKNTKTCGRCGKHRAKGFGVHKGNGEISNVLFYRYYFGAKNRKLEFCITAEYIWNLFLIQNRRCPLTGIELKFTHNKDDKNTTASLDRINPKIGYVEGNVRWIYKQINIMKMDLTDIEFISLCNIITNFNKKDNNEL